MSLLQKPMKQKQNKTENMANYMKQYREENIDHFRNLEKTNYYRRKYKLDDEFINKFGELSGNVYKLVLAFNEIKNKEPQLIPHILQLLEN
jgi:predicted ATP-dependent protease